MAAAVDEPARGGEVVAGQRGAHGLGLVRQKGGQQQGSDLGRVGQVGLGREVHAQQLAVGRVVGAPGELHEAAALEERAVAGPRVAQHLADAGAGFVGREGRAARRRVEARRQLGDRHEALALGADGAERGADHGPVAQPGRVERGHHIGQVARHVGRLGGREQQAHGLESRRHLQRRRRAQAQQALAQRADHAIGDQAHAGLPASDRGLAGRVEHVALGEAGKVGRVVAELPGQFGAQPRDVGALAAAHQQVLHGPLRRAGSARGAQCGPRGRAAPPLARCAGHVSGEWSARRRSRRSTGRRSASRSA